jgi:GNAT superfamily N-acetyltransferase
MRPRYRIRLAKRGDLHALPYIERAAVTRFRATGLFESYARHFTSAEHFEERQHRACLCVAVDRLERPVGFAAWSRWNDEGHLEEMDVLPSHGCRGIGAAMLAAVCALESRRAANLITLSTTRDVPWNLPFYRRHGFLEVAESALSPRLRELRAAETAAGLPLARRVIMQKALPTVLRISERCKNLVANGTWTVL